MAPGLRPFMIVLFLAQVFALWWMSGQYSPRTGAASEEKLTQKPQTLVADAEKPAGKFWGSEGKGASGWDESGRAISIRFQGPDWRGCGYNWKSWYPADACDDASGYRSLTFR